MVSNAIPEVPLSSRDLGNDDALTGFIAEVVRNYVMEEIENKLPAVVISFDAAANRVEVQPLISMLRSDNTVIERQTIPDIPVFNIGTARMSLRFNIQPGDLGWIEACDRDISLLLQGIRNDNSRPQKPNTLRTHKFGDAVFYPDSMRGRSFDSTADAIIANQDGSVKAEFFQDRVDITAPTINAIGNVNLGENGNFIARLGDAVQVTVPATTFLVSATGGVANPGPVTLNGEITAASGSHTAS